MLLLPYHGVSHPYINKVATAAMSQMRSAPPRHGEGRDRSPHGSRLHHGLPRPFSPMAAARAARHRVLDLARISA
jgi:hypothetical protein